jgi:hypothetical protein
VEVRGEAVVEGGGVGKRGGQDGEALGAQVLRHALMGTSSELFREWMDVVGC